MKADQLSNDTHCFIKAKERGQHTFTVVAQDMSAPATIVHWIELNILTAPPEKLRKALEDALLMREYPNRKVAD